MSERQEFVLLQKVNMRAPKILGKHGTSLTAALSVKALGEGKRERRLNHSALAKGTMQGSAMFA